MDFSSSSFEGLGGGWGWGGRLRFGRYGWWWFAFFGKGIGIEQFFQRFVAATRSTGTTTTAIALSTMSSRRGLFRRTYMAT